jgi:hypothetical protein
LVPVGVVGVALGVLSTVGWAIGANWSWVFIQAAESLVFAFFFLLVLRLAGRLPETERKNRAAAQRG